MNYQKINNISGWLVFAVATIVYVLSVEMTASFWDAGEFIAVSYKLMVPHPPGAPFYLLVGRMFSFLSFGDVESVAFWINMASVLSSSFTILFTFWSITLIGRKIMSVKNGEETLVQTILLMAAGTVGALTLTFSDSFWFSAVEAEVYAMSSFFTAFVFWAILKWEVIDDDSQANKWLILIAYMMGLSIGVHLLNLVTIPVLALVIYYKKGFDSRIGRAFLLASAGVGVVAMLVSVALGLMILVAAIAALMIYKPGNKTWEVIITLMMSGAAIGLIMIGIIPGLPTVAGAFEIFFVNSMGLPFGSGIIVFAVLFIAAITAGIVITQKKAIVSLNTALIGLTFVLIGYTSYTIVVIRSSYDPPIDQNDPENVMDVVSYLKREQYGNRPLVSGQYFDAQVVSQDQGRPVYIKGKDKYVISDYKVDVKYDPDRSTIFPRMYSTAPEHRQRYRSILGLEPNEEPTFIDNIRYMIGHQLGTMYGRYFFFNFIGRQSDIQDADWLAPWESFQNPPASIKANKGRNNYFAIPFLLGIIGLLYQYYKNPRSMIMLLLLFFLTGAALVLYLNSPPVEPRERDYIYAGSYYAYSIWVGLSVLGLYSLFSRGLKNPIIAATAGAIVGLASPVILAAENWDDHDRSNRYFSVDSAKNRLSSCSEKAIVFTGGDNDTFPSWYVQDVEGFRTDTRVVVLSYFNTDWYIGQMTRQAYESPPFPFSLTEEDYRQGGPNDYLPYIDEFRESLGINGPVNLKTYLSLIKSKDERIQIRASEFTRYNALLSRTFFVDIDREEIIRKGIVPKNLEPYITDRMIIPIKGGGIEKKDLMILDLIASGDWERALYFNNTSLDAININLDRYVVQEGNTYRLLPVENPERDPGVGQFLVDTERMYDNVMNKFQFRDVDNPNSYMSEDYRNFVLNHRSTFNSLAEALINEGEDEKAREVIMRSLEVMPDKSVNYDYTNANTVQILFHLGDEEKALEIAETMGYRAEEELDFYLGNRISMGNEVRRKLITLRQLSVILSRYDQEELATRFGNSMQENYERLQIFDTRNR